MENLKIISGNSNPEFARKVAQSADLRLCDCEISRFSDGEVQVEIHESIRGSDVFVIQSTCPPVNENYMELFIILDALKRASARSITAVLPYFGYARQDRKVKPRVPISAKCVSDLISSAGANRILAVDLHSSQIQGSLTFLLIIFIRFLPSQKFGVRKKVLEMTLWLSVLMLEVWNELEYLQKN